MPNFWSLQTCKQIWHCCKAGNQQQKLPTSITYYYNLANKEGIAVVLPVAINKTEEEEKNWEN